MNREIKFRAKTVNEGEWVYGMTISHGTVDRKRNCLFFEVAENKWKGVIPETLGQFTGLIDRNGKEIYEGDIVRYIDVNDEPKTSEVRFVDAAFSPLTEIMWMGDMECEVIGNIHDNQPTEV